MRKDPSSGSRGRRRPSAWRSEEHTSELQSQSNLVCRLLLEKKKKTHTREYGGIYIKTVLLMQFVSTARDAKQIRAAGTLDTHPTTFAQKHRIRRHTDDKERP